MGDREAGRDWKKKQKQQQQYFKIKAGEWTDRHRQIVKKNGAEKDCGERCTGIDRHTDKWKMGNKQKYTQADMQADGNKKRVKKKKKKRRKDKRRADKQRLTACHALTSGHTHSDIARTAPLLPRRPRATSADLAGCHV